MARQASRKTLALFLTVISILFLSKTEARSRPLHCHQPPPVMCMSCPIFMPPPPCPQPALPLPCPQPPPPTRCPRPTPPPPCPLPPPLPPTSQPPAPPQPQTPPPPPPESPPPPPPTTPQPLPPPPQTPTTPQPPPPKTPPPETPPPPPTNSQPPPPPPETPRLPPSNSQPPPPPSGTCPRNAGQVRACSNVLRRSGNFLDFENAQPCCSLIRDLSDAEAAACLCNLVNARRDTLSSDITILCRTCGRRIPRGFTCP